jgi:heat shock protein HtpX
VTLYTQVSQNRTKTAVFLVLFSLLFIGIGAGFAWYFGNSLILAIVGAVVVVQGLVSWWFSDSIALLSTSARTLAEDPRSGRVTRLTENLCITAGLPMPRLYLIDDTAMNAFATGRDRNHAAVALTTGLVDRLDDNELSGVIAHELSHIGNEDIRLMSMVMIMAGLIALLSDVFLRSLWTTGRKKEGDSGANGALMIIALVLAILAPLAASLMQLAISRKREFMADANAVLLTRYPEGMIAALQKISGDTEALEVANRGNAHMYFANPLRGQWLAGLFSTHPPVEQRIAALQKSSGM